MIQAQPNPPQMSEQNPVSMEQLSPGARLLIWSIRQWVVSAHLRRCPSCDLFQPHADMGCPQAVEAMHGVMSFVSSDAARKITLKHPADAHLTQDEFAILRLFALTERKSLRHAERIAQGLVKTRITQICAAARCYRSDIASVGMELSGWPELRLVSSIHRAEHAPELPSLPGAPKW